MAVGEQTGTAPVPEPQPQSISVHVNKVEITYEPCPGSYRITPGIDVGGIHADWDDTDNLRLTLFEPAAGPVTTDKDIKHKPELDIEICNEDGEKIAWGSCCPHYYRIDPPQTLRSITAEIQTDGTLRLILE